MINTVSIVGSVSRLAGGLFESVRRLHGELLSQNDHTPLAGTGDPNISVQVLSLRDEFTEQDLSAWEPVPVQVYDGFAPKAFGYSPRLLPELLTLKPDLVHVHGLWEFSSVAALRWHRTTQKPYLVSPHGMLDHWALRNSRWKKMLAWLAYERSHLKSATCIRALSQAEAAAIRALGLTNPICTIPNGVEVPKAIEEKRNTGNRERENQSYSNGASRRDHQVGRSVESLDSLLEQTKVLLYFGRIHPKKGLINLLKAWAKVPADGWRLVIAGWGQCGHELELKRLANELELDWTDGQFSPGGAQAVFFAGPQFGSAKENWLRRCDALILPSFSEGIPMTILEAWACAKPVLLTPQCNLPEGFAAGAALRINPEPDAIAAGLREFFRLRRSSREQMGLNGLALVSRRFAWPQIASDLRGVYYWMTGAGPKPDCVSLH